MLKKKAKDVETASSANVIDGKLVLSFPNADTPVVWQMDLEQAKTCAIEIKNDKKTNLFTLIFKRDDGEKSEIASFVEKNEAVEALMATSNALQHAHGKVKLRPVMSAAHASSILESQAPSPKSGKSGIVLAILLIIALFLVWSISSMPRVERGADTSAAAEGGTAPAGIPESADDFLSNNR